MKKLPTVTISELIEAGVHFGHKTMRWNPKMSSYLYGIKDDIHIIDLQQTLPLLYSALNKIYEVAKNNGRILFVGTKMQASEIIAEAAKRCGQYYINHRWLGGTLTNWSTINRSIKKLADLEKSIQAADQDEEENRIRFTKKERLDITRKIEKLEKSLGGIREIGGLPDLLFVIDTNMEEIAIKEANKLGIPVVAILDSNSNPDDVDYPVPGNDDATRSIKLYCRILSDTILQGIQDSLIASGIDIGESAEISDILQMNASLEKKSTGKHKETKKKAVPEVKKEAEETKATKKEEITEAPKKKEEIAKETKAKAPKKKEEIAEVKTETKTKKTKTEE
ncbi:MAG: 30S ribosomal protein S2 [Pseudomonadota bacterium]